MRNSASCPVGRVVQIARTDGSVGEDLVRRRLTKGLMLLKFSRVLKTATVPSVLVKFAFAFCLFPIKRYCRQNI